MRQVVWTGCCDKFYSYRFGAWLMHLFMVQVDVQVGAWLMHFFMVQVDYRLRYRLMHGSGYWYKLFGAS
jgi:UDP-galactopyranose mutase